MPSTPEQTPGTDHGAHLVGGHCPAPGLLRIIMYRRPTCLVEWALGLTGLALLFGVPLGLAVLVLWLLS